jgi:hypothetical protein
MYRSQGGAPRQVNGHWLPAKTNAYLITPHLVHGSQTRTVQLVHPEPCISRTRTVQNLHENGAAGAPNVFKEVCKEEGNNSLSGAVAPRRVPATRGSPAERRPADSDPPTNLFQTLLQEAQRFALPVGATEAAMLEKGLWQRLTADQQSAAVAGVRQQFDGRDPAYVPALSRYLHERLWERPVREKPKSKAEQRLERLDRLTLETTLEPEPVRQGPKSKAEQRLERFDRLTLETDATKTS